MSIDVKIPSMGESITGGILAAWHAKDGDFVKRDQILYDLETDKITSEGVAESDGRLSILVEEGAEVEIGQKVASIDPENQQPADSEEAASDDAPEAADAAPAKPAGGKTREPPDKDEKPSTDKPESDSEGVLSPAVRRLAEESGVNPAKVSGTGKGGRVTKGDMIEAIKAAGTAESSSEEPEPETDTEVTPPAASVPGARRKMSPLRRRIAERLVTAQREAAILSTFNEVDMSAIKALRARYQEAFTQRHGI